MLQIVTQRILQRILRHAQRARECLGAKHIHQALGHAFHSARQSTKDGFAYIIGGVGCIAELVGIAVILFTSGSYNATRRVASPVVKSAYRLSKPLYRLASTANNTPAIQSFYVACRPVTRTVRTVCKNVITGSNVLVHAALQPMRSLGLVATPRHIRSAPVTSPQHGNASDQKIPLPSGTRRVQLLGATSMTSMLLVGILGISLLSQPQYLARHKTPRHNSVVESRNEYLSPTAPTTSHTSSPTTSSNESIALEKLIAAMEKHVTFKKATTPPAPLPPNIANAAPLGSHEVFAFLPYWQLPDIPQINLSQLTTVSYFAVHMQGNGSLIQSGSGWSGLESQQLSNFITVAHAASTRVVLTVNCFSQSALNNLSAHPQSTGSNLAQQVIPILQSEQLNGLNLDLEGTGAADRHGLAKFVSVVSTAIRSANPYWQVTMDTYASSAGDPYGFFDINRLAPSVNAFFVMAYDMNSQTVPSPTSPLTSASSFDVETALSEYTSVVPASKVILGLPFYGYVWPTTGGALGDPATGSPVPETYAQIMSTGNQVYWDPATSTPWMPYKVGSQWYQAFFDNPTSIALKVQAANAYGIRGVGAWAIGMEGNDNSMIAALAGNASVIKTFPTTPTSTTTTTTTTPPTTTTTTTPPTTIPPDAYYGSYSGKQVTLYPIALSVATKYSLYPDGTLNGFKTGNSEYACLTAAKSLPVYGIYGSTGKFVVQTVKGPQCVSGTWTFSTS